jgi:hypothetical protein
MEGKSEKFNYIPLEEIATTGNFLWTGLVYAIKSVKHQAYLHPGA